MYFGHHTNNSALLAAAAFGLACTMPQPASSKDIDLRTMSEASGVYDVAFCSRPSPDPSGKPGHAFVAFSHKPPDGDRDFLAIGLTVAAGVTPAGSILSWFYWGSPVSGRLKAEQYTDIRQNCLNVGVDKQDYDRARALTDDPLQKLGVTQAPGIIFENYKLGAEDCMTFLTAVARKLEGKGLKVPQRGGTELPMHFVQRFIDAN